MATEATGYAGNPDVQASNLDRLAAQSINLTHAVAGCSVCCPSRASLVTGQYPLTPGVFVNDVHLADDAQSIGKAFHSGVCTAYIVKSYVDGRKSAFCQEHSSNRTNIVITASRWIAQSAKDS